MIKTWTIRTPEAIFKLRFNEGAIQTEADRWTWRWLNKMAGYTRKVARTSIKKKGTARPEPKTVRAREARIMEARRRKPSLKGTPPYTWTGLLRNSIRYELDRSRRLARIGPTAFEADQVGGLHEYGGRRYGKTYPARPFMRPALRKTVQRIRETSEPFMPRLWHDSVRIA